MGKKINLKKCKDNKEGGAEITESEATADLDKKATTDSLSNSNRGTRLPNKLTLKTGLLTKDKHNNVELNLQEAVFTTK